MIFVGMELEEVQAFGAHNALKLCDLEVKIVVTEVRGNFVMLDS